MSRAKELKTNPENNVNLFELFSLFSPEGKSKYTETLLRIMKKTPNIDGHKKEIIDKLNVDFKFSKESLNQFPTLHLLFFWRIIDSMFNTEDLQSFQKFCELNERGLIKQNDLSKYNSFEELMNALSIAETVADQKEMEKQIRIVFEDDEWLMVRPLTYHASRKYGSNTKWCTTQENNPDYFIKYASKGVLIYVMNKKSGYKVASFNSLDKNDPEFSFWNQKDTRIDSMQTELPDNLLSMIKRESTINAKTNRFLLSDDERIKEEKILKGKGLTFNEPSPIEEIGNNRRGRIRRALIEDETVSEEVVAEQPSYDATQEITMESPTEEELPDWDTPRSASFNG
jgi:hypothetical protein